MHRQSGFSLTELLIVVSIIGILAAIAIPAYIGAQGRALTKAAREETSTLAAAMEGFYQEHNRYGNDGTIEGREALSLAYPAYRPTNADLFNMSLTIRNNGQNYLITATPPAGGRQFPNKVVSLTLNERNEFEWIY